MAFAREEYFVELLEDCIAAVNRIEVPEEHQGAVVAALIQSDSINGLRKALMLSRAMMREPMAA